MSHRARQELGEAEVRTRHHFPGKGREEETGPGGTTGLGSRPGSLISLTPPWLALLPALNSCKTSFPELPPREVPQAGTGLHQRLVQGAVRREESMAVGQEGSRKAGPGAISDRMFFLALAHRQLYPPR